MYIRVTLVTVTSDEVPDHYIHPYPIDTPDSNALQDRSMNTIYFPIYENDFRNEEKRFIFNFILFLFKNKIFSI